ncbi:hypothetical protein Ancab_017396 [Ancistrocladus abbreviatus]
MQCQDLVTARKRQKADKEKSRRDQLSEQFIELGNVLDSGRPKYGKATILMDTIELLIDLTAEVSKLKAEFAALTEECRELAQEKNDLREEKATIKSEIGNLTVQCQLKHRATSPWFGMNPLVLSHPSSYPFPMPMPAPSAAVPIHPSMQPYPFFGSQNPVVHPNPCTTFVPYMASNPLIKQPSIQPSIQPMPSSVEPSNVSHVSGGQDSRKPWFRQGECQDENIDDSCNVPTDVELRMPGSAVDEDASSGQKLKRLPQNESSEKRGISSSTCSSSPSIQDGPPNSIIEGSKADD